jgi:hypothetical protein
MAVTVRVVAFAVSGEIFFRGHFSAMQAVGGGESVAASEMSFHDQPLATSF